MNTLYFEKISRFDRQAEPVTVSIPFTQGKLTDPPALVIRDGDIVLSSQRRVLATWPDGSVKWLLVHLQPDLLGNADKTLRFDVADDAPEIKPQATVKVTETPDGIEVEFIDRPVELPYPQHGLSATSRRAARRCPTVGGGSLQRFHPVLQWAGGQQRVGAGGDRD